MSVCAFKSNKPFTNEHDTYLEELEARDRADMIEDTEYELRCAELDAIWDDAMSQAVAQGDMS